jgi:hypothetical protein
MKQAVGAGEMAEEARMSNAAGGPQPDELHYATDLIRRTISAIAESHDARVDGRVQQERLAIVYDRSLELQTEVGAVCDRLRDWTQAFARAQRAAGAPPEQVVVELKTIVDGVPAASDVLRDIERDVVRWGIEAYYAA